MLIFNPLVLVELLNMSAVELRLSPSDLPREMGAMRVWLDQHRFEPSCFSCRDVDDGLVVSLEFKVPDQAVAFAERFGGRAGAVSGSPLTTLDAGVSTSDIIG
jgi:hypothetical protein